MINRILSEYHESPINEIRQHCMISGFKFESREFLSCDWVFIKNLVWLNGFPQDMTFIGFFGDEQ